MTLKSYSTINEMLADTQHAKALDATNHPAQQNAVLNRFAYKKYVSTDNQVIIVKEFNQSSYNGPTTYDFIERLNILYEAAKCDLNTDQLNKLKTARQTTLKKIHETCEQIPNAPIDYLLNKEKDLIKIICNARQCLQEFLLQAVLIIDVNALNHQTRLTKILTTISNKESSLTAEKGRPNFINYYPVTDHNKTTNRVSMNRVIGHAIPSTERMGKKLPNFVECGIGYMNGDRYISQFKGYRHSSYTPIKMIDEQYGDSNYQRLFGNRKKWQPAIDLIKFKRRQAAALCAKEMLTELAKQQIAMGANVDKPIPINLSSLALLSPIKGDKTFMRRGESEHRQLKESYNALMMYNGRDIQLDVDGRKVAIKPSINIMNAASNWHGIKLSKYMPSTLEKNINAEGMNQYITKASKHLMSNYMRDNRTIERLLHKQVQVKEELSHLYTMLDQYLNQTVNPFANLKYIRLLKSIEKTRNENYVIEHKILNERLTILKEKRSDIQTYLNKTLPETNKKPVQQEIEQLYYESLFMYLDKHVEPAQFGARYLLVNEKIGNAVDFYCKSGKDRTGRMQNLIEELCEFSKQKGYFPRYDFDKKSIKTDDEATQRLIAKVVSEYSVSRDNANANTLGARGLQITSAIELNAGLPNRSGSIMGRLARAVYDTTAIKKLWRAQPLLSTSVAKVIESGTMYAKKRIEQIKEQIKEPSVVPLVDEGTPRNRV